MSLYLLTAQLQCLSINLLMCLPVVQSNRFRHSYICTRASGQFPQVPMTRSLDWQLFSDIIRFRVIDFIIGSNQVFNKTIFVVATW